ncbi:MAG: GAF domain-containing protein [Anaerolineales bacterium]
MAIDQNNIISQEAEDIIASVSQQLSSHIENLRLLEETQVQRSQLSDALTTAKLANWEFDVEKDIFTFNDNFYAIFHTTAKEVGSYQMSSAQYAQKFVYPDDLPIVGMEIEKALSSKDRLYTTSLEHRILYADGGVGYITVTINLERDEDGKIVRYNGANQDITERKISELALRESEARLAEAAAIAKLGYWEFDVRTETYTFTDQFYALLGTTAEKEGGYQMSAKDYIQKYMHPDDRYMVSNEIQKSTSSADDELFGQFENRFIRADGSEGYVTGRSRVIKDAQGQVVKTIGFNQDITERKLAEEELRINEARLAEALEIARLANWEYDVEKDIFTFNDSFYSIFRTTVEEVGSYQISSAQYAGRFVHPDDLPIVGAEIEKALTSKERFYSTSLEHRIRYADGSVGYISVNINVERDENGKITRYYGANQDITERKQAEEIVAKRAEQLTVLNRVMAVANSSTDLQLILQTATEEFRMLMQAFSAGVLMLDEEGESLTLVTESYADPNMPRLAGRSMPVASNPATNKSIKSGDTVLVPNAQTDPILAPIHAIMKQRNIQSVLVTPLISRNKVIGVFSVDTNQTDRLFDESDIALIETLAKQLASAIESIQLFDETRRRASDLSTVATVSTATSTILDPDQLLQTVVDITKERFNLYHAHIYLTDNSWDTLLLAAGAGNIGKQMMETGHAIPIDAEKSLVARAARERRAIVVNNVQEEEGYLPNALLPNTRAEMTIPMVVGETVLGVFDVQSDKPQGFSNEDADIYTTLATQVAVALQNARLYVEQAATVTQLRELDRLKSSFLANMSHELRTPLNSILGFTDVMLEELDGPLTPNMDTDLKLIQKNGKHLLHLINDVLDMAKIESGKMNLLIEKFNLHEIIEEVISITSPLANEKNLALYTEPDSNHDVDISADHTRLRQVMINLVNNAIKFTEKGNVSIRAEKEENNVLISVHDTGIGIPISHLEDVFLEFTQVDTSTTRKAGGTGLGLPISRRLIEMHGGRLWAESTGVNGEGSTFYIFLPLEAKVAENVRSEPHIRK